MGLAFLLLVPLMMMVMETPEAESEELDVPEEEPEVVPDAIEETPEITRTGFTVSEDLFGANAVYSVHTDEGDISETFNSALEVFEIENLRYPAGQAERGPGDREGHEWLDITELTEDGELRPELTNFLDQADTQVTLTIPTTNAPAETYGEGLAEWAELVVREYGDQISAFEIGNEYWSRMDESEYGALANEAILALASGIEAAGAEDPDIIVQMASCYGKSAFNSVDDERGFIDRVTDANYAIIDELSDEARAEVDGVVEHYYWNKSPIPFEDTSAESNYIDIDIGIWQSEFDQDLDFHITEWNIRMGNTPANGLLGMAVMVEMVENMVELGVDSANVWPVIHNATTDLGGPSDDGIVQTDDQGRVTETVRGAVFDLMATELPGMELIQLDIDSVQDDMEVAAYENDGEFVIYLSNTSLEPETITVDLSSIIPDFTSAEGVQVGYDPETSDGRFYKPRVGMVDARSVLVNGEEYYLNEHDTGALLTDHTFDSSVFTISLNPHELLQITAR